MPHCSTTVSRMITRSDARSACGPPAMWMPSPWAFRSQQAVTTTLTARPVFAGCQIPGASAGFSGSVVSSFAPSMVR